MSTGDAKGFRFRESTRAPYKTPVSLRFERDGETTSGYSANVSMEGMFVETNDPRPVGTLVQFEFELEGAAVQGLGDVVWIRTRPLGADKPPGMGVQFRYVDPQSRDLIARIVDRYLQEGKESTAEAGPQPVTPVMSPVRSEEEARADPMDALLEESALSTSTSREPTDAEPVGGPPPPAAPTAPPEPLAAPSPPIAIGEEDQDVGEVEMLEIGPARSRRWIWIAAAAGLVLVFAAWWFGLVGGRGDADAPLAQAITEPEPRTQTVPPVTVEPAEESTLGAAGPEEAEAAEQTAELSPREAMPELDSEEDYSSDFEGLDEEPLEPLPGSESEPVPPPAAVEPEETPAPAQRAPDSGAPVRLQSIEAQPSGEGTVVTIRANAPIPADAYSTLRLTGPPRLLVRIDGIIEPIDTRGVRASEFQALRAGLHRGQDGTRQIHLVFDLASESVRSGVELDGGVLRVRLRP